MRRGFDARPTRAIASACVDADQRWGVPTKVLLLDCIDVAGVAEELGAADAEAALEDQLRAVSCIIV